MSKKYFTSKRILLIKCLFLLVSMTFSNEMVADADSADTLNVDSLMPQVRIIEWHFNKYNHSREYVDIDTSILHFHHESPVNQLYSSPAYLGNVGQAAYSNAYFDNYQQMHDNIFVQPFRVYHDDIDNPIFFNVTRPFTELSFTQGQSNNNHIKVLHTQNVKKNFNFGGRLNYWESEGAYVYQKTNFKNLQAFYSYDGARYKSSGIYSFASLRSQQLEGITNDSLLKSKYNYSEDEIPARTSGYNQGRYETEDAVSKILRNNLQFHQEWNLGRPRIESDSMAYENLPFKHSFGHSLQFEKSERIFTDKFIDTSLFSVFNEDSSFTKDYAKTFLLRNELFLKLLQTLSSQSYFIWQGNFGLKYIDYRYKDVLWQQPNTKFYNEYLSASLFGKMSDFFNLGAYFRYTFQGRESGDYLADAYCLYQIPTAKDTLRFKANVEYKCETPSYYYEHYAGNYFSWSNSFDAMNRLFAQARFDSKNNKFGFEVDFQTIDGYLYFAEDGLPNQADENIVVFSAKVQKLTRIWKFYLSNNIVYQSSSNDDFLPLPTIVTNNSFYFRHTNFEKKFDMMLGFEGWYSSKYYAPAYNYTTGMFHLQTEKELGNYPYFDVFMNLKVKRLRFYVKYNHFNSLLMDGNHFGALHYPMPRANYSFGFSWLFYN